MSQLLPIASARQTRQAVGRLVGPHRGLGLAAVLVLLAGTAAGALVPPVIGHLVDLVRQDHGAGAVTAPVLLLVVVGVVQALFTAWGQLLVARLGETVLAGLRERVVDRALRLPLARVEDAGSGDVVARVSGDVAVVAEGARGVLPALVGAGLTVAVTVGGLAALDWRFAVAGLLAAPVQLHTLRWYLGRSAPIYARERMAEGERTQQLLDSVGGAPTVRAYASGAEHVAAVGARSAAAVEVSLRTNRLLSRFYGRLNLAEFIGLAAILLTGWWLVRDGAATVGAASAAALYFHRLFDPINTLLGLVDDAQEAGAGLARLVGVADLPEPSPGVPDAPAFTRLSVDDVRFGYRAGHDVLSGVSVRLERGEHLAVVGASGAGKTTLARLVAGVYAPTSGAVRLGDVAVHDLDESVLHRHVALVTQEVHVFAGTLADDLRLAAPEAADAELRAALDAVGALAWVDALPDGLATVVGEGGHALSAARAQELALARVVLLDPDVVVLDEATADAGSAGARRLDRAAAAVLDGRTAVVVAHRLSQAVAADRVAVLDAGRVVELGSHDDLVTAGGAYAELWRAWSGARPVPDGARS